MISGRGLGRDELEFLFLYLSVHVSFVFTYIFKLPTIFTSIALTEISRGMYRKSFPEIDGMFVAWSSGKTGIKIQDRSSLAVKRVN